MEDCYGQHGWREFHRNRKNILAEFDKILELTSNRPIHTAHGNAVEAYIRKWLSEFLPKKYGVTSGYIIPNLYDDAGKIYHYDIIIYNLLDAPVLWTEGNEDNSEQGKYRAIPAHHVVAVYEVKSQLTRDNVTDALNKLNQTRVFSDQLNRNYSCGVIFIELKERENSKDSIIKELHKGKDVFGFSGGMVLRYEGDHTSTGLISIFKASSEENSANNHLKPLAKPIDNLNIYITEDGNLESAEIGGGVKLVCTSENTWSVSKSYGVIYTKDSCSVYLGWARTNFSEFCIDLLGALEGLPYNDSKRNPFGRIFDSVTVKKAPLQFSTSRLGLPFIVMSLYGGGSNGEKFRVEHKEETLTIEFWVEVENQGNSGAKISDNGFQTSILLQGGDKAVKPVVLMTQAPQNSNQLDEKLNAEGLEILYRLVYQTIEGDKEFFAVEKLVRIVASEICLADVF